MTSKLNSPDAIDVPSSLLGTAVGVSYSSVDFEPFESRPGNLGGEGFLVLINRQPRGLFLLLVLGSQRLKDLSKSDRLSGRGL